MITETEAQRWRERFELWQNSTQGRPHRHKPIDEQHMLFSHHVARMTEMLVTNKQLVHERRMDL